MTARAAIPTLLALIVGVVLAWQIPRFIVSLGIGASSARADDSWYSERLLAFSADHEQLEPTHCGAGLLLLRNSDEPYVAPAPRPLPEAWRAARAFGAALEGELSLCSAQRSACARPCGRLAFDPSLSLEYQSPAMSPSLTQMALNALAPSPALASN